MSSYFKNFNQKNLLRFFHIIIFIGSIMVATGTYKAYVIGKIIEKKESMKKALVGIIEQGRLRKKREKTFTTFTVDMGAGTIWNATVLSTLNNVNFDLFGNGKGAAFTMFGMDRFEPLRFTYRDKKVFVSTKVFDRNSEIVCEIENNEWTVNANNYYKRNYDDKAVEVIDKYDNVVLSVELFPNNIIEVRGIFTSQTGDCVLLDGTGFNIVKYSTAGGISQADYNSAARSIPRKFLYNGEDYLGKRIRQ